MNFYHHSWWIFCEYLRSQNYLKYISINVLSIFSCSLLFWIYKLISRIILFIKLNVLIISLHLIIWKSLMNQYKLIFKRNKLSKSQIFLLITSIPQSILYQNLQMMFKLNEKSYSIFLFHDILSSMMIFSKNMIYLFTKLSMI